MRNLISAENYINFSDVIFSAFISKNKITDYIQNGYEVISNIPYGKKLWLYVHGEPVY